MCTYRYTYIFVYICYKFIIHSVEFTTHTILCSTMKKIFPYLLSLIRISFLGWMKWVLISQQPHLLSLAPTFCILLMSPADTHTSQSHRTTQTLYPFLCIYIHISHMQFYKDENAFHEDLALVGCKSVSLSSVR